MSKNEFPKTCPYCNAPKVQRIVLRPAYLAEVYDTGKMYMRYVDHHGDIQKLDNEWTCMFCHKTFHHPPRTFKMRLERDPDA